MQGSNPGPWTTALDHLYVDIFDGGPTVDARVAMLKTVARSRRVRLAGGAVDHNAWQLVRNTHRDGFAAVQRRAGSRTLHAVIDTATRARLGRLAGPQHRPANRRA